MDWLSPELGRLLARGLLYTVALTAITSISSLFVGILVGSLRISGRPLLSRAAAVYVEIFRNIPALVLIIFFGAIAYFIIQKGDIIGYMFNILFSE